MYTHDSQVQENLSPDSEPLKRNYRFIPSSSEHIYRTVKENSNRKQSNQQLTQLTLSQLELLENYDPAISAKIGVPFIPIQMLVRPRGAGQIGKRSIDQIQRDYPK